MTELLNVILILTKQKSVTYNDMIRSLDRFWSSAEIRAAMWQLAANGQLYFERPGSMLLIPPVEPPSEARG